MKKSRLLGTLLFLLAFNVNAVLVSTDLYVQGDGLLTLDTDTGLEWLDQSVCASYTLAELNQCGLPSGFRTVADDSEIRTFLEHAGVDSSERYDWLQPYPTNNTYQAYQQLLNLTYFTPTSNVYQCRISNTYYYACNEILGVAYSNDSMPIYTFLVIESNQTATVLTNAALAVHPDWSLESIALVRAAVPIPPALYLFGSGLLGLVGIARRRS